MKTKKPFLAKDIQFVKNNKQNMTYAQMADKLGHPVKSVGKFVREHTGLKNNMSNKKTINYD